MKALTGFVLTLSLLACTAPLRGATPIAPGLIELTEHTVQLAPGAVRPEVSIAKLTWLVGAWKGQAFGASFEETWNAPSAGSMVGFFKLMEDDEIVFYELLTIAEGDDGIEMRVRHFNADFSAWEDKEDFVRFRLLHADPDVIHFSGLSFYRRGEDNIDGYIVMRGADDALREEALSYVRYSY